MTDEINWTLINQARAELTRVLGPDWVMTAQKIGAIQDCQITISPNLKTTFTMAKKKDKFSSKNLWGKP